jgi:hypothetical protein
MIINAGNGWHVLANEADWIEFKANSLRCRFRDEERPGSFPCLVAVRNAMTVATADGKTEIAITPLFVYMPQVVHLYKVNHVMGLGALVDLERARQTAQANQLRAGTIGNAANINEIVRELCPLAPEPIKYTTEKNETPRMKNHQRYVRANFLAIWRALRPTISAEQAHDLVLQALSDVDRWDRDPAQAACGADDREILEQLDKEP